MLQLYSKPSTSTVGDHDIDTFVSEKRCRQLQLLTASSLSAGAAISADSESLVLQLTQSDCAQIQDDFDAAYSAAAAIATAGSLIVESVDQVIPELDAIAAYAQEYIKYSFIGAGVCFFLVIIIVMVYAIGMSRGMKSLLYWNVVLSLILYGLLLTFCSVAIVPIVSPSCCWCCHSKHTHTHHRQHHPYFHQLDIHYLYSFR